MHINKSILILVSRNKLNKLEADDQFWKIECQIYDVLHIVAL